MSDLRSYKTNGVTTQMAPQHLDRRQRELPAQARTASARASNAGSVKQEARYQSMRVLLEDDPEWHDGEIVSFPSGFALALRPCGGLVRVGPKEEHRTSLKEVSRTPASPVLRLTF